MILEYRRASTVAEAVSLLQRPNLLTLPLGGGTHLSTQKGRDFGVVDLQDLKFDRVEERGDTLSVGSTLSLDRLAQLPSIPAGLRKAIVRHQTVNLRQVSTVAGELIAADGR
ncbi:MAG TPA: FAD binding domain-containing protein, partial [Anaerolineaceae bacterium]|nr:FAD binding domain-containing protein [Anaerolineaceae bacterium]